MRLRGVRKSTNIEDRRGQRRVGGRAGGLSAGAVLLILAIGYFTGIDVVPLLEEQAGSVGEPRALSEADQQAADFTSRVLATTEQVWAARFEEELGRSYQPPVLVLFGGATQSPCGGASGATGPFYCPADQKAYLDTQFFATMSQRLGAGGDFAAAYVVAHEVAHHVQNQLGILKQVHDLRRQSSRSQANALTVRLELQADCLSGVWAASVQGLMERGDLAEALNAARMIGDDQLQRSAGRVPQPHTFTHGTSAQRARWFERGFDQARIAACDTFSTNRL
ncbi:KPN_02809 family neutral zinc metallopeptidase [Aestuariivita boseongensis]|uniref:KPN_02809 family neutral zinc metallopeptidase n=1 Tax=Aestuariivita boseongensis TaxID=1470562 RepID=UPI000680D9EA|nr:neutral zinc metallopeptidase [Aestuariivita boseongensis]